MRHWPVVLRASLRYGIQCGGEEMQQTIAAIKPATTKPARARQGLLDWLDAPTSGRGLHFADDDGGWTFWEYPCLAALVAEAAARIEFECTHNGPVSIAIPSGPEFVAAFLGTLVAGHTPSPLALPIFLRDPERYIGHVAAILEATDPALVLAEQGLLEQLTRAVDQAGFRNPPVALDLTGGRAFAIKRRAPAELALLQFTSGSSGRPRGVRVSWENLETNIAMIGRWTGMRPEDAGGTWLPLYHDMGLIGALLFSMVSQSDLWILRPDQFIREPLRWLELFGRQGVSVGVAPNFGFAYVHRRVSDEQLDGMDFSGWKAAIVAAERVDPDVLTRFALRLAPYGFKPSAYLPAYGLAEGTLAVTGVPQLEIPRSVKPNWASMGFGQRVHIEETLRLGEPDRFGSGAGWLVSCGRPLEGVSVSVLDDDGRELPQAHLGEIRVQGPTVALGYTGSGDGSTRFTPEGLITGDAGVLLEDELYVLGRIGDSVKVRGRTLFVEDIEAQLAAADGVSKGKVVVLAGGDGRRNMIAAVVEATRGAWVHEVSRILEAEVGREASIKILASPPRTIQRTSSGKPRRRVMWREFLDGSVPGEVVFSTSEDESKATAAWQPLLARGFASPVVDDFRERVREQIARHVSPHTEAAERERRFPRASVTALGGEGLLRERWIGGDHGDAGKAVLISEELGRSASGGVGVGISVHLEAVLSILRRFGHSDALRGLCEQALDGRALGCIAASERANGSDLGAIEAVAHRTSEGWRITGEKRYVSLGAAADFALVLGRERDAQTNAPFPALTLFAVPRDQWEVRVRLQSVGNRSLETVTIEIDAHVPDDLVLSRPGRGLHTLTWGLTHERLASAAQALGVASLAIELASTHAKRRVQFGARLFDHQAIRVRLGQRASQVWMARAGLYALAASLEDARPETARHVAAAKATVANMAERVVSDCMQVLGGRGYLEDATPLARLWRDVRLARIGGGTDEMMWEMVAAGLQGSDELYDSFVPAEWS
jgi:alkylation response protein AidB-like acyl-CoA dehydrogenase/acyl-CoA synthetase (AMP-forming)/AMP-acid ligase II